MKDYKINDAIENVEEINYYTIIRFLAVALYFELILKIVFGTSLFAFTRFSDFYEFIVSHWQMVILAFFGYYPVLTFASKTKILIQEIADFVGITNVLDRFQRNNKKAHDSLIKEQRIVTVNTAHEIVRLYNDKKLEKEIVEAEQSAKNEWIKKHRLTVIFLLLLIDLSWSWYTSNNNYLLRNVTLQIATEIFLYIYILYREPSIFTYVLTPLYLTTTKLTEIEKRNSYSNLYSEESLNPRLYEFNPNDAGEAVLKK